MNARAIRMLALALSALPLVPTAAAAEPAAATLRERLAAELLSAEPAPAAPAAPTPASEARGASPAQNPPLSALANPVVGSAAASVPAWPALVLLAGLGGVWAWTRRRAPRAAAVPLQRLASLSMGGRRSLVLVEVMNQRLLVGCSEKGLSLLARLDGTAPAEDEAAEGADPSADERSFGRLLQAAEAVEAAERRPAPAAAGSVPGEQRDLARKLRGLGRI